MSWQGDLYRPMCGRSAAVQADFFPGQGAKDPEPERRPDLEGQGLLFPEARRVGPVNRAAICAGCGATVPNSWSNPRAYVHVGGQVYCDARCERRERTTVGLAEANAARIAARKALARLCDTGHLAEDSCMAADWELCQGAAPAAVVAELVKQQAITPDAAAEVLREVEMARVR